MRLPLLTETSVLKVSEEDLFFHDFLYFVEVHKLKPVADICFHALGNLIVTAMFSVQ